MPAIIKFFVAFLILSLSGCDLVGTIGVRSGTVDDDYVEEPLSGGVEKFEPALVTSNNILHMISQSKYSDVYRIYFSDAMKAEMTRKEFKAFMNQVKQGAGALKAFKPMQWNFSSKEKYGRDYIYSIKIAEHEKGMLKYLFIFERDKPYIGIAGFSVKERQGVSTPGQF